MIGQMEPMLARMSGSMFGAQVGPGRRRARRRPAQRHRGRAAARRAATPSRCCRRTSPRSPRAWRSTWPQVRLYLAVREAARVRLFADVPWLGAAAGRGGAGLRPRHQHRHRADRVGAAVGRPHRPRRDAVGAAGPAVHAPSRAPAQRAALGRLETYLALVEGWVDVVAERATAGHLPHGRRAGRGRTPPPRHRRPGREDVRRPGRPRAAPAPAARRREPLGRPRGRRRGRRPRRRLGATPTSRRPRPTSTTRWATSSARAAPAAATTWTPPSTRSCARASPAAAPVSGAGPGRPDAAPRRRVRAAPAASRPGAVRDGCTPDAEALLASLDRARRGAGGAAPGVPRAPARPTPTRCGSRGRRRTSRRARWCSTPRSSTVLLTLHRKAGAWFQFGGHFEPGDARVHAAATREAREESGHRRPRRCAPSSSQLDRHAAGRGLRPVPRAPRHAVRGRGRRRAPRHAVSASRSTCGGGRSTRLPEGTARRGPAAGSSRPRAPVSSALRLTAGRSLDVVGRVGSSPSASSSPAGRGPRRAATPSR